MKALKKLSCVLLAVLLIMSLSTTAFAAEGGPVVSKPETTFTLQITNSQEGHEYVAYQIFSGTLTAEEGKADILTNIEWGNGLTGAGQAALAAALGVEDDAAKDAAKVAEAMEGKTGTEIQGILEALSDAYWQNGTALEGPTEGAYKASVSTGYYMVKDTVNADTDNFSMTEYIVQVVGTTTVTPKTDIPHVEKKVQDKNDSTGEETGYQDSADHDIGDEVPFQLTATLPNNYKNYKTYELIFHDVQSPGLDLPTSVTATVGGVTVPAALSTETGGDGCSFHVSITLDPATQGENSGTVVVTYTAKLNEDAVIGAAGNPNEVYLEYSNNTNTDDTGKTTKDKVIVFTFDTQINKVDEDGEPLSGAEFTLEKWVDGTGWVAKTLVPNGAGNVFTCEGIDDGYYRLKETATPAGYNSIDDIYFMVEADHSVEADSPVLADLRTYPVINGSDDSHGEANGGAEADDTYFTATMTPKDNEANLNADIVNQSGLELPETGGIGTTIFYTVGGILVVVALVLLVTKKRMTKEG